MKCCRLPCVSRKVTTKSLLKICSNEMNRRRSIMKQPGPNQFNSWVIAATCCFINMMLSGIIRLSGLLFVASVLRFNVSRAEASFPYTFCNSMRYISGPLVAFLGHKFGVRPVTTFGCILGAFGASMCYFAENILTVTVLWGAVFGLGLGMGDNLLPISINQYFDKYRATASGIAFSGNCLGSFTLPPVADYLINTYGLSGTFLFLGGFILNCVPAALLLQKPNFEIKNVKPQYQEENSKESQSIIFDENFKLYTEDHSQKLPTDFIKNASKNQVLVWGDLANSTSTYEEIIKRLSTETLLSKYSIRMSSSEALDFEEIMQHGKSRRLVDPFILEDETNSSTSQITDPNLASDKDEVFIKVNSTPDLTAYACQSARSLNLDNSCRNSSELPTEYFKPSAKICSQSKDFSEIYNNTAYQENTGDNFKACATLGQNEYGNSKTFTPIMPWDTYNEEDNDKKSVVNEKKSISRSFGVIFDPVFILVALSNAMYTFTFFCMITVIVDFARDLDVGESNEKYLLMSLSIGDLVGRLCLGSVTDRGYMTNTRFAALCFICQGFASALLAWSTGFFLLMGFLAFYGLSESGVILIIPLIIAEYIEESKQTVAIPCSHFLSGPLCLAVAPLIGYFRDEIGSYDYMFYGIGILSGLCCVMLLLVPCVAKGRRKIQAS